MYDVLCVGTTTVDLYYKGKSLHHDKNHFNLSIGGKYFADFFYEGVGGGATNVAIGIAKLGGRAGLYTEIGQNSFKRLITDKLEATGVHFQHCVISPDYSNVSTVLLTSSGERTIINYRNHKSDFLQTTPGDNVISKSRILYMGNLGYVSEWHRARLLKHAKSMGMTNIVTLGSDDCRKSKTLIDDILRYTDILIINQYECADLLGAHVDQIDWKKPIHNKYSHIPIPKILIVTMGAGGSFAYHGDEVTFSDAVKPSEIVDTSGAGDGYTAGFIYGYIQSNGNLQKSMDQGSKYASRKLSHLGAN